jgi:outer membrane receptor protein involved in Fe transport
VRISILWKPTDWLTIQPSGMWQLTQQNAPNAVDINGDPTNPTVPSVNAHWEPYDTAEPQRDRFTLGALKVEAQLQDFSVTSATGDWNRGLLISQDGSEENGAAFNPPTGPVPYNPPQGIGPTGPGPQQPGVVEKDFTRQFTEELRATSTGSGPFQWIAGYFYQDLYSEWDEWSLAPQATPILGGPNVYVDYQPQTIIQNSEFGEVSWQFTDQFKATAGARHFHYVLGQTNEEYGAFTVYSALGNTVPYNTSAHNSASGTDPKFDLTYEFNKDLLVYATVAKGFRLGGVNQPIPVAPVGNANAVLSGNECGLQQKVLLIPASGCSPALGLLQAPSTFGNDSVWNYEIGEKASLFDRRLILNASGYFERWENPQLATNLAGFGITVNGGEAQIFGFEGEMQALIAHDWDFNLNVGYTNAKFVEASTITGYPSGAQVPDIPKVTSAATIRWHHQLNEDLGLFSALEGDYVGNRTDAPYGETITLLNINSYLVHLPAYGLINARFGFTGSQWQATLFVNNLTNKEVLLDPQPQINLQTTAFARYLVNQPLTGGLDVTFKFK